MNLKNKIKAFWVLRLCCWVNGSDVQKDLSDQATQEVSLPLYFRCLTSKMKTLRSFVNVGNFYPKTALYPIRFESSVTPL
jgi:hypothetical protein